MNLSPQIDPPGPDPEHFEDPIILSAEKITKLFPGTVALSEVDFKVYRGQVNVLIGENGAGKSTLMKILAGVDRPTRGRLILDGKEVVFKSTREAAAAGVGIIFQELNLFPNLNIAENIFAGREITRNGTVQHQEQEGIAEQLLKRLEQPIHVQELVSDLRMGQQQIVEIAKALSQDVRVLIMDEPTSALTAAETDALFRIIHDLKARGVAIVYISHKLEELLRIGDYVTVLRDGKLAAEAPAKDVNVGWIIEKMVGRSVRTTYHDEGMAKSSAGKELLKVENLTLPRAGHGLALDDVSFTLQEGEILAIYGLMGAGRTELFECLMGLHPESSGGIWLDGQPLKNETLGQRIEGGITLLPEDRQRLGLIQLLTVRQNITLASLARHLQYFWLSDQQELDSTNLMIKDLAIKTRSADSPVTALSGGNQQKVVLAKCLLTRPKVLLLDEPTRGVDVGAKAEIFQIITRLATEGIGIIFVSSELPEVLNVPTRVLVLSRGKVTGNFEREEISEERLVLAAGAQHQVEAQKTETLETN